MRRLTGWHGEARGTLSGAWANSEMYVALDRSLAETYAADTGRVLRVSFDAHNPLILRNAESAANVIRVSGMVATDGTFHGHTERNASHRFADWARAQGYDAVVFEPTCFEQTDDSDAAYAAWDDVAGTFGDPQMIILDPARAILETE